MLLFFIGIDKKNVFATFLELLHCIEYVIPIKYTSIKWRDTEMPNSINPKIHIYFQIKLETGMQWDM